MTLTYAGNRKLCNYRNQFKGRLGEIEYNEHEEQRLLKIADYLREQGWEVDTGVEGWAGIQVEDRSEFDLLMEDYKTAKKIIK